MLECLIVCNNVMMFQSKIRTTLFLSRFFGKPKGQPASRSLSDKKPPYLTQRYFYLIFRCLFICTSEKVAKSHKIKLDFLSL